MYMYICFLHTYIYIYTHTTWFITYSDTLVVHFTKYILQTHYNYILNKKKQPMLLTTKNSNTPKSLQWELNTLSFKTCNSSQVLYDSILDRYSVHNKIMKDRRYELIIIEEETKNDKGEDQWLGMMIMMITMMIMRMTTMVKNNDRDYYHYLIEITISCPVSLCRKMFKYSAFPLTNYQINKDN